MTQLFEAMYLPGSSHCDKIKSKFLTDDPQLVIPRGRVKKIRDKDPILRA